MKFILRHTRECDPTTHHYFLGHGENWPHRPGFKLIGHTTSDRAKATRFDAHSDAMQALKLSDDPPEWEVDEVAE